MLRTARVVTKPHILLLVAGMKKDMTVPIHNRATANGVAPHYATAGSGPVVLCVHGWGQNHRDFLPVIDALGDQYTFIAPDLRGHADGDRLYDGYDPYTITDGMLT